MESSTARKTEDGTPFDPSADILEVANAGLKRDVKDSVVVEGRRDISAQTSDPCAWSELAARSEAVELLEGVVGRDVENVEGLVSLGVANMRTGAQSSVFAMRGEGRDIKSI